MATVRNFFKLVLCFFTGHNFAQFKYGRDWECVKCGASTKRIADKEENLLERFSHRIIRPIGEFLEDHYLLILSILLIILVIGLIYIIGYGSHWANVYSCEKLGKFIGVAWAYSENLGGCLLQAPDGRFVPQSIYTYTVKEIK